jgi:hypothetical protein
MNFHLVTVHGIRWIHSFDSDELGRYADEAQRLMQAVIGFQGE